MKFYILRSGFVASASMLAFDAEAGTYPGQACVSTSPGYSVQAQRFGSRNDNAIPIWVTCPIHKQINVPSSMVIADVYFTNDDKFKLCYLDGFNIDTGGLSIWTSATGVTRLTLPTLRHIQRQALALTCLVPVSGQVNGYIAREFND